MGNSLGPNDGALLVVDRPCVFNLEPDEEIVVEICVKNDVITLNEWPAQAIGLPPPVQVILMFIVWAVNRDDPDERRICGSLIVPHTSIERFGEETMQIWLGLLDPSMTPSSLAGWDIAKAEMAFNEAMELAKEPTHSKVNLTISAIQQDLLRSNPEDQALFRDRVQQKPIMRLLTHSRDIITQLCHKSDAAAREILCVHREFASKEKLHQGFVSAARHDKTSFEKRIIKNQEIHAERVKAWFRETLLRHAYHAWKHRSMHMMELRKHSSALRKMCGMMWNKQCDEVNKTMPKICAAWYQVVTSWRRQFQLIHQLPTDGHVALEISWHAWRHQMLQEEKEYPAKVRVSFTMSGFRRDIIDDETMMDLIQSLKRVIVSTLIDASDRRANERGIKLFLHQGNNLRVSALMLPIEYGECGELLRTLMKNNTGENLSILLTKNAIALPGLVSALEASFQVSGVNIEYIRGETERGHRDKICRCLSDLLDIPRWNNDFLLIGAVCWAWHSIAEQDLNQHEKSRLKQQLLDQKASTMMAVDKFLSGENRELLHYCLNHWIKAKADGLNNDRMKKYEEDMKRFITDEKSRYEGQIVDEQSQHERDLQYHHLFVENALMKWAEGDRKAVRNQAFSTWRDYAIHAAVLAKRRQDVHDALLRSCEGEDRAGVQLCFSNWAAECRRCAEQRSADSAILRADEAQTRLRQLLKNQKAATAIAMDKFLLGENRGLLLFFIQHWHQARLDARQNTKTEEIQQFISDERARLQDQLESQQSQHARDLEYHHLFVENAMLKWAEGDTKAMIHHVFSKWRDFSLTAAKLARRRQDVHDALLRSCEGEDRAAVQLCFANWAAETKYCAIQRQADEDLEKSRQEIEKYISDERTKYEGKVEEVISQSERDRRKGHACVENALLKWEEGDAKGIRHHIFSMWRKHAAHAAQLARRRQDVHAALLKSCEGDDRAAVQLCFSNWASETKHCKMEREFNELVEQERLQLQQFVEEQKTIHGEELQRHLTAAEERKEKAHEATQFVIRVWHGGNQKGLLATTIYEWRRYERIQRDLERRHEAAKVACMSFVEGKAKGVQHLCFRHWVHYKDIEVKHREKNNMKDELDSLLVSHGQRVSDMEKAHLSTKAELEAKHNAVDYAVKCWTEGVHMASVDQCFHLWKQWAAQNALLGRQRQAVHAALLQALEGHQRAIIQLSFTNWSHEAFAMKQAHEKQVHIDQVSSHWQTYVEEQKTYHGQEIERHLTDKERIKEQSHEVTGLMIRQWHLGDTKGLAASIVYEWKRMVEIMKEMERRHEAAKAAVMSFAEGKTKAATHLCFVHWVHYTESEAIHQQHATLKKDLDSLGDDYAKQQQKLDLRTQAAKTSVELAVRKWELGNVSALRTEAFTLWHKHTMKWTSFRRGKQAVRVQTLKFLEGERTGLLHGAFIPWKTEVASIHRHKAAEERLGKSNAEWQQSFNEERANHRKELSRHCVKQDAAYEGTRLMLCKWDYEDAKGRGLAALYAWGQFVANRKEFFSRHQASKQCAVRILEGNCRTPVHVALLHWAALAGIEKRSRSLKILQQRTRTRAFHVNRIHAVTLERCALQHNFAHWRGYSKLRYRRKRWHMLQDVRKQVGAYNLIKQAAAHAILMWKIWVQREKADVVDRLLRESQKKINEAEARAKLLASHKSVSQEQAAIHLVASETLMTEAREIGQSMVNNLSTFANELRVNGNILDDLSNEVTLLEESKSKTSIDEKIQRTLGTVGWASGTIGSSSGSSLLRPTTGSARIPSAGSYGDLQLEQKLRALSSCGSEEQIGNSYTALKRHVVDLELARQGRYHIDQLQPSG